MTAVITPKRDTKTGQLYHYCPVKNIRIEPISADQTPYLDCCEGCIIEWKSTRYEVRNHLASTQLYDFEIPKAHDTYRGLKGQRVVDSTVHTWVEPKLDGARALVHCTPDGVIITTRRRGQNGQYTQIQDNVPHLRDHRLLVNLGRHYGYYVFDGEIIAPTDTDTLSATMSIVGSKPQRAIATQEATGYAILHLFDIAKHPSSDFATWHLAARRHELEVIFSDENTLSYEHIKLVPFWMQASPAQKTDLMKDHIDRGLEGLVIKNPNAVYGASQAWLKVKPVVTYDVQVTGWERGAPGGKYAHTLGALLLSSFDADGAPGSLQEICKAIPGDDATRDKLFAKLSAMTTQEIIDRKIIVEVQGQLMTKDGRVRHPRILRWRKDRSEPNTINFKTREIVS